MDKFNELTLEQQFTLKQIELELNKMGTEQLQDYAISCVVSYMLLHNATKDALKEKWFGVINDE